VIEWLPPDNAVTVTAAVPACSVPLPIGVVPSRNVTEPVAAAGDTVAVNVTVAPGAAGFWLDVTLTVVAPTATVNASDALLPIELVSPL